MTNKTLFCKYCDRSFADSDPIIYKEGELYHQACLERKIKEEVWVLEGLKYDCPKCFGMDKLCKMCRGSGRLKSNPKTKIGVIGWEIDGIFYPKEH